MVLNDLTRELVARYGKHERINVPGHGMRSFSGSSTVPMNMLAVRETLDQFGVMLQSATEAVAVRMAKNGVDYSGEAQLTRTGAIYFLDGGTWYVGFDDIDNPDQNVVYRATEHMNVNPWEDLTKSDSIVKAGLERAEKNGRVMPLTDRVDLLTVDQTDGKSEFGDNPVVRAILGDSAEPYAQWLHWDQRPFGAVILLRESQLNGPVGDEVLIQPIMLGGDSTPYGMGGLYGSQQLIEARCMIRAVRPLVDLAEK